jgi:hypothetical protein
MSLTDLDRFKAACVYPGKLDEQAVERELAAFLQALGVSRQIVRLRAVWLSDPPANRNIGLILAESVKRNFRPTALLNVAARLRAGPRFYFIHDDDHPDFASRVRSHGVAGAALDALAVRRASEAGAAYLALNVLDARAYLTFAFRVAFFAFAAFFFPVLALIGLAFLDARARADVLAFLGAHADVLAGLAAFAAIAASVARAAVVNAIAHAALVNADARTHLAGLTLLALFACAVVLTASPTVPAFVSLAVAALADVILDRGDRAADAARAFAAFAADPRARALRTNWRGSMWELSWTVCALFGAIERRKAAVEACLRPLFEAFVCGCWLLYWAGDTLYWVAKPTVRCEPGARRMRLHHDAHAALESDIVNLYFRHGLLVPLFAIAGPITITDIDQETNAEIRRVMIERYRHGEEIHGAAAFIRDAGGERLDHDERYGTLWRRNILRPVIGYGGDQSYIPDDEPIVMIELVNRTPEPDGRFKHYWLRVPPTMRTAREAVAWTFNMPAEQYAPEIET